jgi:hypothetical protein
MTRFLGFIALMAMVLFAVPAIAQQEQDTSAIGRQGEGVTPPSETVQPQAPTDEAVTPTPGANVDESAYTGKTEQTAEQPGQTGVTQRAAEEQATETTPTETTPSETTEPAGGEMPTTASPLPLLLAAGMILVSAGVALRLVGGRR